MRSFGTVVVLVALASQSVLAQAPDSSRHDKTFLTRRDLGLAAIAVGATALLSHYDVDIARASRDSQYQRSGLTSFSQHVSKVNETTLTAAGIIFYGVGRLTKAATLTDVALHATESVVLASVVSQVIRGPLGRARPYVTNDTDQYNFSFGGGFRRGDAGFRRRAFPSIHTSSGVAVATVLSMELHRRHPSATPFVAPVLFAAGVLPGLVRIQLNQHWASDVAAGAFMGAFAGYKVVSYSHDHPNNWFDRTLLRVSVSPSETGGMNVGFSPF
ncbi:MAG: phosphatase PAP2 family protein [Gemmatimonadaceae bacterium]|nr:phosphatase PAP2 family protein [Gemmatimonadaceae bacterium]